MLSYTQAKLDLTLLRKQYRDNDIERHIFTTMFDYYALPEDFPGFKESKLLSDVRKRISFLESEFFEEMATLTFLFPIFSFMNLRHCFLWILIS